MRGGKKGGSPFKRGPSKRTPSGKRPRDESDSDESDDGKQELERSSSPEVEMLTHEDLENFDRESPDMPPDDDSIDSIDAISDVALQVSEEVKLMTRDQDLFAQFFGGMAQARDAFEQFFGRPTKKQRVDSSVKNETLEIVIPQPKPRKTNHEIRYNKHPVDEKGRKPGWPFVGPLVKQVERDFQFLWTSMCNPRGDKPLTPSEKEHCDTFFKRLLRAPEAGSPVTGMTTLVHLIKCLSHCHPFFCSIFWNCLKQHPYMPVLCDSPFIESDDNASPMATALDLVKRPYKGPNPNLFAEIKQTMLGYQLRDFNACFVIPPEISCFVFVWENNLEGKGPLGMLSRDDVLAIIRYIALDKRDTLIPMNGSRFLAWERVLKRNKAYMLASDASKPLP